MFVFLQNQGLGSIPLVFAIFVAARVPADARCGCRIILGVLILLIGILGEALADAQLKRFPEIPPTRAGSAMPGCGAGRGIRDYFFEWFGWLAYPVIALSLDYPWDWRRCWRRSSCTDLVYVTGIPPLEAQMLRSRGDRYQRLSIPYQCVLPLPPPQRGSRSRDRSRYRSCQNQRAVT